MSTTARLEPASGPGRPTLAETILLLALLRDEAARVVTLPGPGHLVIIARLPSRSAAPGPTGIDRMDPTGMDGTAQRPLTPREREVLAALATGATNKQIAEGLRVSPKTVMHHSVAIYKKLGVSGRAGATAWAYQHGLVGLD